jgi:hypothetical protein
VAAGRREDDGRRLLRMFIALTAGIVMGALSTFVSEKASAAPVRSSIIVQLTPASAPGR